MNKNKPLKYYRIAIDGIDKSGKDVIQPYMYYLADAKYLCRTRGIISILVYNKMYNRENEYDYEEAEKLTLNVLLTVNKEDWEMRCKIAEEPYINYEVHSAAFNEVYEELKAKNLPVLTFNTSEMTPFQIAKEIANHMTKLNS